MICNKARQFLYIFGGLEKTNYHRSGYDIGNDLLIFRFITASLYLNVNKKRRKCSQTIYCNVTLLVILNREKGIVVSVLKPLGFSKAHKL